SPSTAPPGPSHSRVPDQEGGGSSRRAPGTMATRYLYLARHGSADPFGALTPDGREQARLLGQRLAHLPIDAVWHSPLPRAQTSARIVAEQLAGPVPVAAANELVDHVPYVPPLEQTPPAWVPF